MRAVAHLSPHPPRRRASRARAGLALLAVSSFVLAACGEGPTNQVASNSKEDRVAPAAASDGGEATSPRETKPAGTKVATTVPTAKATVAIKDDVFEPTEVEVAKGDAITWKWEGKNPHNVAGPGFKSKIQTSGSFTKAFAKAGTFDYRCEVHPTMEATVTVTG